MCQNQTDGTQAPDLRDRFLDPTTELSWAAPPAAVENSVGLVTTRHSAVYLLHSAASSPASVIKLESRRSIILLNSRIPSPIKQKCYKSLQLFQDCWLAQREVYQFYWSFQRTRFYFLDVNFINPCSNFIIACLLLVLCLICSSLSTFLNWKLML